MNLDVIAAHKKIGTAPEFIQPIETLARRTDEIREQRFEPGKVNELISIEQQTTVQALASALTRKIKEAETERDRELSALETAIKRETTIAPQHSTELDSQYHARLSRAHITETRRAIEATYALGKAQIIGSLTDPAKIAEYVNDTMMGGDIHAISLVADAAEVQLGKLSRLKRGNVVGSTPASSALLKLQDQMRTWRAAEAERSPTVQRQRIHDRFQWKAHEAKRQVLRVAESFQLRGVEQAIAVAALPARPAAPASAIVEAPFLQRLKQGNR